MSKSKTWREEARASVEETLRDAILSSLLARSNLTRAQFETLLVDQLGHDMANRRLSRDEMAQLLRNKRGISRGALNRTLRQARINVSEAVHSVLLLGYAGFLETPSLARFLEASERLKAQTSDLREIAGKDEKLFRGMIDSILEDLEEAFQALLGKTRDT